MERINMTNTQKVKSILSQHKPVEGYQERKQHAIDAVMERYEEGIEFGEELFEINYMVAKMMCLHQINLELGHLPRHTSLTPDDMFGTEVWPGVVVVRRDGAYHLMYDNYSDIIDCLEDFLWR